VAAKISDAPLRLNMANVSWRLLKNIWYTFAGLLYEPIMSALAFYNFKTKWGELQEHLGTTNIQLFGPMYVLCILGPLWKVKLIREMWPGLDAGSHGVSGTERIAQCLRVASIAARSSSVLAFEAAQRTRIALTQQTGGEELTKCSDAKRWRNQRLRFRVLFPEDTERAGLSQDFTEIEIVELERSRCGRTNEQWFRRFAQQAKDMTDNRHAFYTCIICRLANVFPWGPGQEHPAFPRAYYFALKRKLWSVIFHVLFYAISVWTGAVQWWSPTWLLKLCMAIFHVYGLRKAASIRSPWPLERFGVLSEKQLRWPAETLWHNWSFAASQEFAWDRDLDWWALLDQTTQDVAESDGNGLRTVSNEELLGGVQSS
jgi:hypothetical protein